MPYLETMARELAGAYSGGDPDELVTLLPAGPTYRLWEHFVPLAELIMAWLHRYSRPTA
jgi:hypothetical protein